MLLEKNSLGSVHMCKRVVISWCNSAKLKISGIRYCMAVVVDAVT